MFIDGAIRSIIRCKIVHTRGITITKILSSLLTNFKSGGMCTVHLLLLSICVGDDCGSQPLVNGLVAPLIILVMIRLTQAFFLWSFCHSLLFHSGPEFLHQNETVGNSKCIVLVTIFASKFQ